MSQYDSGQAAGPGLVRWLPIRFSWVVCEIDKITWLQKVFVA